MSYRFADSCLKETCRVSFQKKNKFEKLVQQVGFVTKIYHDSRLNIRFIRPENSNCDFAERKILILLSVLRDSTPKAESTNTVHTQVPITAFWEWVLCSDVLGHHLS
jgi:hypothetical protein